MKTFNGTPCKRCGGTLRRTCGNKQCIACKVMSDRAYYQRHKERENVKNRARYHSNRDVNNERNKAYSKKRHIADPRKTMLRMAKHRARISGMECTITLEDIVIPELCPLLGIPIFVNSKKHGFNSPSLDRILNTYGYVTGNVLVVSHRANGLKRDAQSSELLTLAFRLAEIETKARNAIVR